MQSFLFRPISHDAVHDGDEGVQPLVCVSSSFGLLFLSLI